MKKIKIDNVEYTLTPTPLHLSPFSTRIGILMQQKPESMEDIEKNSAEIEKLQKRLLDGTVTPEVRKEHVLEVYTTLVDMTNEIIERSKSFRKNPRPDVEKSGPNGSASGQATKPDPQT